MIFRVCLLKLGTEKPEGLRIEEAIRERLGGAALSLQKHLGKNSLGKEVSSGGATVSSLGSERKGGLGDRFWELAQGQAATAHCSLVASLVWTFRI